MNINHLLKLYIEEKKECWQFTEYIKHNPVLYPRVGDIFLKELFALANPDKKMPYNRRKKIQMDTVWYKRSKASLATFVLGCEIARVLNCDMDIQLQNGQKIPFYAYYYLTCLFLGEAQELSLKELSWETVAKLKKEKELRGICKPDSRRYYKAVGMNEEHVASDFPISKHFCPMGQEYECEVECPKQLTIGNWSIAKGTINFRQREELLYFSATQNRHFPKGNLTGELLSHFLTNEYMEYYERLREEDPSAEGSINCQLLSVFAYLTDCLNGLTWMHLLLHEKKTGELAELFKKDGLWQLMELLHDTNLRVDNPLLLVLTIGEVLNPFNINEALECQDWLDYEFDSASSKIIVAVNDKESCDESVLSEYKQRFYNLKAILQKTDITLECTF